MGTWLSAVRWAEVRIPNHVGDNLATAKEVIDFFAVIRICEGLLKAQLDS